MSKRRSYIQAMMSCGSASLAFLRVKASTENDWGVHNILPKQGTVQVFNGPYAIAGVTPAQTIAALERLNEAVHKVAARHPGKQIRVFAISAGTLPGFLFANRLRASRLVAVAPGPRMGQGIYTSIFSADLAERCRQAGYATWQDYDRELAGYNHMDNIANLPEGSEFRIFASRFDPVIKYSGTRELVELCQSKGKHPLVKAYWLHGHTSLGAWLGFLNKTGQQPYGSD